MSGERGGLGGASLHHAAVAGDDEDAVVHQSGLLQPGFRGEVALGDRHADAGGEPAAERAGGDVHTGSVAVFRMPRGAAVPLAEVAELLHRKAVAEEVEQAVLQHRTVSSGKYEAVAAEPVRILRVVTHILVPQRESEIRTPQRHARMARLRLLDRFRGEHPDRIGGVQRFFEIEHHSLKSFLFSCRNWQFSRFRAIFTIMPIN